MPGEESEAEKYTLKTFLFCVLNFDILDSLVVIFDLSAYRNDPSKP